MWALTPQTCRFQGVTPNLSVRWVLAAVTDMIAILVIITIILPCPIEGVFITAAPHLITSDDFLSDIMSRNVNVGHRWPARSSLHPSVPPPMSIPAAAVTALRLSPFPSMQAVGIPRRGSHSNSRVTILFLDVGGRPDEVESDQDIWDNGTKTAHGTIRDGSGPGVNDKKDTMMSQLTYSLIIGTAVTGAILVSSSPSDASLLPMIAKSSGLIIAGIVLIVIAEFGCNGQSMLFPQGPKFQSMAPTFSNWRNLATVYAVIASLLAGVMYFSMSQDAIGLAASIRMEDQALAASIRMEDKLDHQKERLDDHKERMGDRVAAGIVVALAAVARNEDKAEHSMERVERRRKELEDTLSALCRDRRSLLLPWDKAAIDQEINMATAKLEKLRKKHNL